MEKSSLTTILLAHRKSLTRTNCQIADYILQNPIYAATMGIEELAAATHVSVATVNRFVRSLGFEGYSDFRSFAVEGLQHLLAPIKNLGKFETGNASHISIDGTLDAVIGNIEASKRFINSDLLEETATLIRSSRRCFFAGFGMSAFYANISAHLLFPFCASQIILDGQGGMETMIRRTQYLNENDTLLAIAVPRYTQFTLDLAEKFKKAGSRVVAVTDAPSSPLAALADMTFYAPTEHPVLHSSTCGIVAVFEVIASYLLSQKAGFVDETGYTQNVMPHLYRGTITSGTDVI
ncbi:MurR/RpiR family transcriptional regulator [Bartonella sp. LJL80]